MCNIELACRFLVIKAVLDSFLVTVNCAIYECTFIYIKMFSFRRPTLSSWSGYQYKHFRYMTYSPTSKHKTQNLTCMNYVTNWIVPIKFIAVLDVSLCMCVCVCVWCVFIQRLVHLTGHCSFLGLMSVISGLRSGGGQCCQDVGLRGVCVCGGGGGGGGGLLWPLLTILQLLSSLMGSLGGESPGRCGRLRYLKPLPPAASLCGKRQTCRAQATGS